jgi:chromosome segregation ATPase
VTEEEITIPVPLASAHQDDMLRHLIRTQHNHHKELTHFMASIDESLDRLFQGITTEIQQVRDELQGQISDLGSENETLRGALQKADDTLAGVQERIDSKSTELEENDPPVEPEV